MILNETSAESNKYLPIGGFFSLTFAVFQVRAVSFPADLQAKNWALFALLRL